MKKKIIVFFLALALVLLGAIFYFRYQVFYSVGNSQNKEVEIIKGLGGKEVGILLEKKSLIKNNIYFNYYIWSRDFADKILPGNYFIASGMTISEIVQTITEESVRDIKITFPEGWTSGQMAERISEKGLDGKTFLKLVKQPEIFQDQFTFLKDKQLVSLEGYLFPDTYFFLPDISSQKIIEKMLVNFDLKVDLKLENEIKNQNKTLSQVITMASIIEREVNKAEDRKIVSGIFWNRIKIGQALQSCATVSYILGENKKQFSYEETRIDSPYNTYINPGLPPGPISNPGLLAIEAAIYPQSSNYNYFLNDPKTGKTFFSSTLGEHNLNKAKVGL